MSMLQASDWLGNKTVEELTAAKCIKSFACFAKRAWQEIDPDPLVWGNVMQTVCDHLQALTEKEFERLIINIPPGHSKSMLVGVMWPAWRWIKQPWWRAIFAANEAVLVNRDMVKRRNLMASDWYSTWFRNPNGPFEGVQGWDFADDQNTKTYYKNSRLGEFTAVTVGAGTGKRGHSLVIDDPINADNARSKPMRDAVIRWKTETMSSRFNDMKRKEQVLIMQRLHEDDLTGYLLKHEKGMWQHLCLMSEFEPSRASKTVTKSGKIFFTDWRKHPGEVLWPDRFPKEVLKNELIEMKPYGYAGQHQQNPAPMEGGILKRAWFNHRWLRPGEQPVVGIDCHNLPMQFDMYAMFTDAAFKKTEDSDYVAIGLFGLKGVNLFMLDLKWERLSFTETVVALKDMVSKWTRPPHVTVSGVYVEDKANGTAVMDALKGSVPALIPVEPDGGKEARIIASSGAWEGGNVILPLTHSRMDDYIQEAITFPKASHDDAIDMTAYAIRKMLGEFSIGFLEALGKL